MGTDKTVKALHGQVDSRGARGIFSRGTARYGVANAPKPGPGALQNAAQGRLKKMAGLNGYRSSRP